MGFSSSGSSESWVLLEKLLGECLRNVYKFRVDIA
ncbi:hypothetical protein PL8927_750079 [Planktothrix serta PCC 8927]|uniref:Uncharacterized protein n=1 Tax=Planktothrix serta PCC 8927 TaxID=671068 RepID=A0A7Z9BTE4_9CYAN|nr:hypothetical protein PL8927_750079 [Planktothrix serta PCC 8927]